jgi:hypothetical protein
LTLGEKKYCISGKDESVYKSFCALVAAVVETAGNMFGYVICGIQPQQLQLVKVRAQIASPAFCITRTASVTLRHDVTRVFQNSNIATTRS